VGRPACFLPSLHGYYASLRRRISKKLNRTTKKTAEMTKNAAGTQKWLQKPEKTLLENKKAYRKKHYPVNCVSFPGLA
jgi:hypothetical protein